MSFPDLAQSVGKMRPAYMHATRRPEVGDFWRNNKTANKVFFSDSWTSNSYRIQQTWLNPLKTTINLHNI
jgi:hypothetical protein